jgi:hypothetical protein
MQKVTGNQHTDRKGGIVGGSIRDSQTELELLTDDSFHAAFAFEVPPGVPAAKLFGWAEM